MTETEAGRLRSEVEALRAQAEVSERVAASLANFAPTVVQGLQTIVARAASSGELRKTIERAKASTAKSEFMADASDDEKELAWVGLVVAEFAKAAGTLTQQSAQALHDQGQQALGAANAKEGMLPVEADLTSAVDGTRREFSTPTPYVPGSLSVLVDGAILSPAEFVETGPDTFTVGGIAERAPVREGERLTAEYRAC